MKLVPDSTDHKLEFVIQKFEIMDPIWGSEIIKINRFALNSVHGGFDGR